MKGNGSNFITGSEWEWELGKNGEVTKKIKSIMYIQQPKSFLHTQVFITLKACYKT